MNKGCDDAVQEMMGDMSNSMQKRAASLEAEKKKSAEEEAKESSRMKTSINNEKEILMTGGKVERLVWKGC